MIGNLQCKCIMQCHGQSAASEQEKKIQALADYVFIAMGAHSHLLCVKYCEPNRQERHGKSGIITFDSRRTVGLVYMAT